MIPLPSTCRGCPLDHPRGFSILEGDGSSGLIVIAESLGAAEEREGLPLRPHAPSGKVFQRVLDMSGLLRSTLTITNTIRCRAEAPYPREALDQCRQYLDAAVSERQPRMILALGDVPLKELTGTSLSLSEVRGYVLDSIYPGVKLIATYHPAHLARGAYGTLFGVLLHDIQVAERYARRGVPLPLETDYNLLPTPDQLRNYYEHLRANTDLLLSIDVETVSLLGQPESDNWAEKKLFQIQFSSAPGEAIVVPLTGEYVDAEFREIVYDILALEQNKIGWNSRLSDEVVLKANGFKLGGEFYDGMAMFSHLQPGFASSKDASDGEDKGVAARLLNLQSAISFYYPYEPLWKDTMRAALHGGQVSMDDVRYGGARDADLTLRVGLKLMASLRKQGLWEGFCRYKHRLGQVLSEMSARGLPIDKDEQLKLAAHIDELSGTLEADLQTMIPRELLPYREFKGWPKDLREAVKEAGLYVKRCQPQQFPEYVDALGYALVEGTLIKPLPFNSGSSQQVLRYIEHKGYPVPTHIDTKKPTTNKAGMEGLIAATGDPALKQIEKCKKITKLKDYCHGKWEPGEDGRVHAEFRVGSTATGQTTATNPPIQTYPKHFSKDDEWLVPTMKRIKSIIKAPPGHIMVETDMRGFHARMQGWLAEDAAYYRLANLDVHSYSTAHYVGVDDKDTMLQLDDAALMKRLKEIKVAYEYDRNYKLKRCIAEGQLVLTNNGLRPIEKVLLDDRVWDGVEWVNHEGVIFQGIRSVITHDSLTATPDHAVFTRQQNGKTPFWLAAKEQSQLVSTACEGTAIRLPDDCVVTPASSNAILGSEGRVFPYWNCKVDWLDKLYQRENTIIQEVWKVLGQATSVYWDKARCGLQSLHSTTLSNLRRLRWPWNQDAVQFTEGVHRLCSERVAHTRELQRHVHRPDRQRWSLRAGESPLGYRQGTEEESALYHMDDVAGGEDLVTGLASSQSIYMPSNGGQVCTAGPNWRTDHSESMGSGAAPKTLQELATTASPTKRVRVYDILNAGPRRRFTVSGKLVSNCSFLNQYGGGAEKAATILRLPRLEVEHILTLIKDLFKPTFRDLPKMIEMSIERHPRLVTPFGFVRWIWDHDVNQAVAFWVASPAHCVIQDAVIRLHDRGALQQYNAVNLMHDALWWCPREEDADACIAVAHEEFERVSDVLTNSLGPFQCSADASKGFDMAHMGDA